MHLGVNLRKAFLDGIRCLECTDSASRDRHPVDTLIHEFCELLGKHGVPEYGLGVLAFPAFLEQSSDPDKVCYYQICAKIRLDRQIWSRYFVSASNAGKMLLLREAALDFCCTMVKVTVTNLNKLYTKNYKTLTYYHSSKQMH